METSRITALTPLGRFDEGIAAYERASASQTHDGAAEFGAALLALCNAGADAYTRSGARMTDSKLHSTPWRPVSLIADNILKMSWLFTT